MKVKCINKDNNLLLTLGKIYTVIQEYRHFYEIENDATYKCTYNKSLFEIVEIVEETQPITPDNIEDVLKYNGFKHDQHEYNYIYNRIYRNNLLQVEVQEWSAYVLYSICDQERIFTIYFDEFLSFLQKRIELKPLPVEEDTNYWDIEGKILYKSDVEPLNDILCIGATLVSVIQHITDYAPLQYQGKESDFTILLKDGTTKRAIWKGKK